MKKILSSTIAILFGISFISCSQDNGGVIPTGVSLDQTSVSLKVGETLALTATVSPSNADNKNVKWTSLDANVASVISGLVSAVSPGETSIIVTTEVGDQTAACKVVVEEPVIPYAGLSFVSSGTTNIVLNKIGNPSAISLEYRKGSGEWSAYTTGNNIELKDKESVSFQAGKGGNANFSSDPANYYQFSISGEGTVAASGNIMSLVSQDMSSLAELSFSCFYKLFENCKKLTKAPELPATNLAVRCYEGMFTDCTGMTQAPKLPATTLVRDCYWGMFKGCTSLTSAPELPATTLDMDCYRDMFMGCTKLTHAPKLPATTLATECYCSMFKDCTSLTTVPELPATTLVMGCYSKMFQGCSSLNSTPELPATTLDIMCYKDMFADCTSLTSAPRLPATTLTMNCYSGMFWNCPKLTKAPELPATTLAYNCYAFMFCDCKSLNSAPELPATELEGSCYDRMFSGCTKLNYVKALFTTKPSNTYTNEWLSDVASNGTFIKNPAATWDTEIQRSVSTVPEGWTITNDTAASEGAMK